MSQEKIDQFALEAEKLQTQLTDLSRRESEIIRSIPAQKRRKKEVNESIDDVQLRIDQEPDTDRKNSLKKEIESLEVAINEIDAKIVKLGAELNNIKDTIIPPIMAAYNAKMIELTEEKTSLKQQEAQAAKEAKEAQDAQLAKEKTERSDLTVELSEILNSYIIKRTERFSLKDKLSPADQVARQDLIDTINEKLTDFIATGNPEPVLETIKEGIKDFHGINLPAALNKVAAKLMEAAPTAAAPVQYSPEQRATYDTTYAEKLETLKEQLKKMHQYGDKLKNPAEKTTVTKLADDLTADLETFQQEHENGIPEPESFKQFGEKFIAKLHSEDDVMHKQTSWKSIVANVAAAVFTLGIALGVKLAHSKITEGRAHLFFSQNTGEKTVEQVEESVNSIKNPAPGG